MNFSLVVEYFFELKNQVGAERILVKTPDGDGGSKPCRKTRKRKKQEAPLL